MEPGETAGAHLTSEIAVSCRHPACSSRYPGNSILTAQDIPYPCSRNYNPAVCKANRRYALIIRNEQPGGDPQQALSLGFIDDGTVRIY